MAANEAESRSPVGDPVAGRDAAAAGAGRYYSTDLSAQEAREAGSSRRAANLRVERMRDRLRRGFGGKRPV